MSINTVQLNAEQAVTNDCASCHFTCCSVAFLNAPAQLIYINARTNIEDFDVRYPSSRGDDIERPVWQSPT
jgi:hypothetical protein